MGSAKSFIKGLAAGAVLAAAAKLVMEMKDDDAKTKGLKRTGRQIMDKVMTHAKKLGKLSRSAYNKIVDTTVAEYRGVKALSESELQELKDELKLHWGDVRKILKK
jgi:hypothetical protein